MDRQKSCMEVALGQFNERLYTIAVARGAKTERTGPEDQDITLTVDDGEGVPMLALLSIGLDIDQEELANVAINLAHTTLHAIRVEIEADGVISRSTIQSGIEQAFVAGALHERERARREADAA